MVQVSGKNKIAMSITGQARSKAVRTLLRGLSAAAIGLLLGLQPLLVCARELPATMSKQQQPAQHPAAMQRAATRSLQDLLDQLQIPPATVARFETLYRRHRSELTRVVTNNPGLLWKTLGLVVDALPALREVRDHRGKLVLSQQLFARANDLCSQYERLASPGLAGDLENIKKFVDRRTRRVDSNHVMINLNG